MFVCLFFCFCFCFFVLFCFCLFFLTFGDAFVLPLEASGPRLGYEMLLVFFFWLRNVMCVWGGSVFLLFALFAFRSFYAAPPPFFGRFFVAGWARGLLAWVGLGWVGLVVGMGFSCALGSF